MYIASERLAFEFLSGRGVKSVLQYSSYPAYVYVSPSKICCTHTHTHTARNVFLKTAIRRMNLRISMCVIKGNLCDILRIPYRFPCRLHLKNPATPVDIVRCLPVNFHKSD